MPLTEEKLYVLTAKAIRDGVFATEGASRFSSGDAIAVSVHPLFIVDHTLLTMLRLLTPGMLYRIGYSGCNHTNAARRAQEEPALISSSKAPLVSIYKYKDREVTQERQRGFPHGVEYSARSVILINRKLEIFIAKSRAAGASYQWHDTMSSMELGEIECMMALKDMRCVAI